MPIFGTGVFPSKDTEEPVYTKLLEWPGPAYAKLLRDMELQREIDAYSNAGASPTLPKEPEANPEPQPWPAKRELDLD